jgi:hypothetical protein
MTMPVVKHKVLWVEDGAYHEVSRFTGPVFTSGRYDLTIALDPSEAMVRLNQQDFSAIVVDVRLPPGLDPAWIDLFSIQPSPPHYRGLGEHLLDTLLDPTNARVKPGTDAAAWIKPEHLRGRVGVLTIESHADIERHLRDVGILPNFCCQKTALTQHRVLLQLLDFIIANRAAVGS